MALAKEQRNRLFIADWKGKGLSTEELVLKYSMSPGGVKALKQRLRAKDLSLYEKAPASKPATQQPGNLAAGEERPVESVKREATKPAKQQAGRI